MVKINGSCRAVVDSPACFRCSLGVNMHIEGTEEWEDEQADILSGKCIDVDFLNLGIRKAPTISDRCFLNCYSVFKSIF